MDRWLLRAASVYLVALLLLLLPGAAAAQDTPAGSATAAPVLDENEALKLQVLDLEQRLLAERAARAEAEIRERQAAIELYRRDFAAKAQELNSAIEAAANKSGIDLKDGWRPNPGERKWVKGAK